ncbi:ACP S-malonyltransferase [Bacillus wiedmannii]|uniref:[acyl-carrier-protein] S-malonyltransferase n=1 Tax=Bacillus wiedmannii TaxID=1890302 RepID=A0A2B5I694_9BACI|nr:ACP S-malonyltransferase [Bacillus wiedmannii]MDF9663744.1 ACP S-malonyltransferase [Bacillus wiedmannii]MDI6504805.1 ACP S-malonyltransferase [Bacillus wiedmannii]MDI6510706.1 ACP S-malonyltransferase [Bacillus wiedmannii]PFZ20135.1 [acyl-carrier-protein] S-malonyltransferase [Bacillus wiedmannii]PGC15343.1 [acyl-carrier-protein] S-malonyltransferase [Bacillus wiedmannii]
MKKIALLFPGQGSQFVGMSKKLYEEYAIVKDTFEEANDALGFDMTSICFEGDILKLTQTENTQPALLTASVAAFRVYIQEFGINPSILAGHSLGEFSALTCSNTMRFSDALRIVRKRGLLMKQAAELGEGKMAAISGIDAKLINEECQKISTEKEPVVVACYNSPTQSVISGHVLTVDKLINRLQKLGATIFPLKVSAAFHSPMMKQAAEGLRRELHKYTYSHPKWKVISNVNALPYEGHEQLIENLTAQMTSPVLWHDSVKYIKKQEAELAIEMGPKTVLKNLMKENLKELTVFQFESNKDIEKLKSALAPTAYNEKEFVYNNRLEIISSCIRTAICSKNLNWDLESYKTGVIEPYRNITNMYEALEMNKQMPSDEQIVSAFEMLNMVLTTKKVREDQKEQLFLELLEQTGAHLIIPELTQYQVIKQKEELVTL